MLKYSDVNYGLDNNKFVVFDNKFIVVYFAVSTYLTGVPIILDWRMIHTAGYTQDLKEKEYSIQRAATLLHVPKAAKFIKQLEFDISLHVLNMYIGRWNVRYLH